MPVLSFREMRLSWHWARAREAPPPGPAAAAHLHLKGYTLKRGVLLSPKKWQFKHAVKKWSVGYFELKLHIHTPRTSKTYFTSCEKEYNRCPLNSCDWNDTFCASTSCKQEEIITSLCDFYQFEFKMFGYLSF